MRIRVILFVAFALVAVIPIAFFGVWPHSKALEKEIEEVSDRHLLLAQNLSHALQRYDRDVRSLFLLTAEHAIQGSSLLESTQVVRNFHFRHICIARIGNPKIVYQALAQQIPCPEQFPAERFKMFQELATAGKVNYSTVLVSPDGTPVIYMAVLIGNFMAVGAIKTTYFVELGKAISFGKKGHAAIVDHAGNVLAHPRPSWIRQTKNISKVAPVKRMLAGETGTSRFYSPAIKADMIAGFTTVPGTGWGVMIPQPMSELEAKAREVKVFALGVIMLGLLVAAIVGWFISGVLTRPIHEVAKAARTMASGELSARVRALAWPRPRELSDLAAAFNGLAGAVATSIQNVDTANRAKSEFLANMSHELRTPLNAILGFSEIIKSEALGPADNTKYRDYAEDIHDSGQHLLEVINDILDLSKIEAGKEELQETKIEVSDLVQSVMTLVKTRAFNTGLEIEVDISGALSSFVADERKMKQILVNLLSNAIKFTEPGKKVALTVRYREDGGHDFQVADDGIGMAPEDIPTSLAEFGQVDSELARKYPGTGLGLPLTKALVELHGGMLEIQSSLGAGTTVTVHLPAPESAPAAITQAA